MWDYLWWCRDEATIIRRTVKYLLRILSGYLKRVCKRKETRALNSYSFPCVIRLVTICSSNSEWQASIHFIHCYYHLIFIPSPHLFVYLFIYIHWLLIVSVLSVPLLSLIHLSLFLIIFLFLSIPPFLSSAIFPRLLHGTEPAGNQVSSNSTSPKDVKAFWVTAADIPSPQRGCWNENDTRKRKRKRNWPRKDLQEKGERKIHSYINSRGNAEQLNSPFHHRSLNRVFYFSPEYGTAPRLIFSRRMSNNER